MYLNGKSSRTSRKHQSSDETEPQRPAACWGSDPCSLRCWQELKKRPCGARGGAQLPCAARGCVLAAGCPAGWERGGEELQGGPAPPGARCRCGGKRVMPGSGSWFRYPPLPCPSSVPQEFFLGGRAPTSALRAAPLLLGTASACEPP